MFKDIGLLDEQKVPKIDHFCPFGLVRASYGTKFFKIGISSEQVVAQIWFTPQEKEKYQLIGGCLTTYMPLR